MKALGIAVTLVFATIAAFCSGCWVGDVMQYKFVIVDQISHDQQQSTDAANALIAIFAIVVVLAFYVVGMPDRAGKTPTSIDRVPPNMRFQAKSTKRVGHR